MTTKRIKNLIKKKGMNVKSLAEKIGYSRIHVSNTIHGHFKSSKVREAIANTLNIEPHKLWGKKENGKQACYAA